MGWTKIKKSSFSSDEPVISLNNNRFSYNSVLSRLAELEKNQYVTYFIDEENRKIGFEFKSNEEPDSFKVILNKSKGNYSQCSELFSKKWIQKTSKLKGVNRFKPIKDGRKFVITLMPIFEHRVPREESSKIPTGISGIYRYLDKNNVVYIGKGNIKNRLKEIDRNDWQFDSIEYSIIQDNEIQFEWESFWIDRFKEDNEGRLPAYNLISGKISQ